MRLISEKFSSEDHPYRSSWAHSRAPLLVLLALAFAALSLALPRPAQAAGPSPLSAFTPAAASPEEPASTEPATAITQSSATLNATVDPQGAAVTECEFEYGVKTTPYENKVPCAQSPSSLGAGTSAVAVSVPVAGLAAGTLYHFRISVMAGSVASKGADAMLTTLTNSGPTAVTGAASSVTATSATLNAMVNPNGVNVTECKFEYGTSTASGTSVPCSTLPGSGTEAVAVSAPTSILTVNTTYHFTIQATNAQGTSKGVEGTFKTQNSPTAETKAASRVGQTIATLNATVNPNGEAVSACKFEYDTGSSQAPYTKSVACTPSTLPAGSARVAVSASVAGLTANSQYRFRVVAAGASGTGAGGQELFKTLPNPPTSVTQAASSVTKTTATLNASVNPNGGEVSECKLEYGTTTAYGSSVPCTPAPGSGSVAVEVSAAIGGLNENTTYHFRIQAANAGGTGSGTDETLKTAATAPAVVTKPASSVTQTSATLNATVNPNGANVTECKFEYGTTGAYGSSAPCTPAPGTGSAPVAVSAALTGLSPNTTYHFRIQAANAGGTGNGTDETLETAAAAPTVVTKAASSVTQASATLNATVNPNSGVVSECELEYGNTSGYGSSAPCTPSPGSGGAPVAVSASVMGLAANTTYHFRIQATNVIGTSRGLDETFTTPPVPVVKPGGPANGGNPGATVTRGPAAPVLARSADVTSVAGRVSIRPPGARAFVALSSAQQIPYGTVVEATRGEISVTAATLAGGVQRGQYFDGKFVLSQGTNGRVLATLSGGNFSVCPGARTAARRGKARSKSAARTHLVRRLWAEARGNFATKGRYAGGVVQGAQWLTEDMCASTLILATREHVEVTDLVRHRHAQVVTGGVYLAKAR
jgi:phosphodiesterase/alkaline phosphatase D-like protein